jgi:hypothetical protein
MRDDEEVVRAPRYLLIPQGSSKTRFGKGRRGNNRKQGFRKRKQGGRKPKGRASKRFYNKNRR